MDPNRHVRLDPQRLLVRARRHGHGLETHDRDRRRQIRLLVHSIAVQIRSEIQVLPVELLEGRGNGDRERDDLVGHDLALQVGAWTGAIIDDARLIATVEAVLRPVVPRVRVVKDRHGHPLQRFRAHHGRDVREALDGDALDGLDGHLALVGPSAVDRVWKELGGITQDDRFRSACSAPAGVGEAAEGNPSGQKQAADNSIHCTGSSWLATAVTRLRRKPGSSAPGGAERAPAFTKGATE